MRPRASRREMRAAPSCRAPSCCVRDNHPEKIDIENPPAAFTNPSSSYRACETEAAASRCPHGKKQYGNANAQRLSNPLEFDPVYDLTPGIRIRRRRRTDEKPVAVQFVEAD